VSFLFDRNWIVSQIGAREHYAIPRALAREGALRQLYTDVWCPDSLAPRLRALPDPFRSMGNRRHPDIDDARTISFPGDAIAHRLRSAFFSRYDGDYGYYRYHLTVGRRFARRVRDHLQSSLAHDEPIGFFGFSTGSLETLEWLADRPGLSVVDQISPGRVEQELVLEESERWPGWATTLPVIHSPFYERLQREWRLADRVVVNSAWSKAALQKQDVPASKIVVVPLAYDPPPTHPPTPDLDNQTSLRVLWLGTVNLRKGIPYLLQAAERLTDRPVEIRVVGPLQIADRVVQEAPPNVTFAGRVERDQARNEYQAADVFVLPTLSDGFAITQLEAMAHSLPVITTPNCGRVVRDRTDGFIVPPRDADAIADAIVTLLEDPVRRAEMAVAAYQTSRQYTIEHLTERLAEALGEPESRPTSSQDLSMP
jgi:glycosyltransferase involved in cell wall biosynthesis